MIEIETPRLRIRPVARADLADLLAINGDPEVTRFLPYATWTGLADGEAWFERMATLTQQTGAQQRVLVRIEDGRVIGTALLFKFDEAARRVELGYVVGRAHWRQGYAREAIAALLTHLFDGVSIRRVEAEVNPANISSAALLRSLGFVHEGHLRDRYVAKGEVYGVDVYGLLARDWVATPDAVNRNPA